MARRVRNINRIVAPMGRVGLNLLFPVRCECCDAALSDAADGLRLCQTCQAALGPVAWPGCPRCGALIPPGAPAAGDGPAATDCGLCHKSPLQFDSVTPLGGYQSDLRDVVLRMKRRFEEPLSVAMGRLLLVRRRQQLSAFAAHMIIPVPMHWMRRLGRGTNSPEILAGCLARSLGISVYPRAMRRNRNTLPQKDLSLHQRLMNVRGAFGLRKGYSVEGARVLLVDDILTTGATCSEAAATLRRAGATSVGVAVIARARGPDIA